MFQHALNHRSRVRENAGGAIRNPRSHERGYGQIAHGDFAHRPGGPRAGFTLIELLVVMGIIALLGALLIAFFPSIGTQTAEAQGAANLQGWINIARQRAIRNQSPYGVRLWVTNLNTFQVTECQFCAQPDDFTGGIITSNAANATQVTLTGADPTGGFNDGTLYPVSPFGTDYLEVLGTGLMHRITAVVATGPSSGTLTLNTAIQFQLPAAGTPTYRVLRAARVLGEETLPFPDGVVVDLSINLNINPSTNLPYMAAQFANTLPVTYVYPNAASGVATGAYVDVLFAPSGAVITPQLPQATMNLWVRAPDIANPYNIFAGTPTVIGVFATTGLTGAYAPVFNGNPPAPNINPYADVH